MAKTRDLDVVFVPLASHELHEESAGKEALVQSIGRFFADRDGSLHATHVPSDDLEERLLGRQRKPEGPVFCAFIAGELDYRDLAIRLLEAGFNCYEKPVGLIAHPETALF